MYLNAICIAEVPTDTWVYKLTPTPWLTRLLVLGKSRISQKLCYSSDVLRSTQNLKKSVRTMRKIFPNFVCFSESPNFISGQRQFNLRRYFQYGPQKINKITITHRPKVKKLMIVISYNLNQIENTFWNYVVPHSRTILVFWIVNMLRCVTYCEKVW